MNIQYLDLAYHHRQVKNFETEIMNVVKSGQYVLTAAVAGFEREWSDYLGVKHTIGLNSGTDALMFALRALGIKAGDRVAVQSHTFAATAYAITQLGAIPVFVDIAFPHCAMDPADLKRVMNRQRIKAVLMVHMYGQCYGVDEIRKIARSHGAFLIEDCAQCHGAEWKKRKAGTFGDISCFSFFPSKNLGALGDAGGLCTNDTTVADKVRAMRNIGQRVKNEHTETWGDNSRLDAVQAKALSLKLPYLDRWNRKRGVIAGWYRTALEKYKGQVICLPEHKQARHVYHQFVVMAADRASLQKQLQAKGIPTLIHYPLPIHQVGIFKKYSPRPLPKTEHLYRHHLSLPMSAHLTRKEVNYIAAAIGESLAHGKTITFI